MSSYFGDRVRRLRTRLGLTQRDLAALVGLSQAQISLHEKGEDLPGPAARPRYARALGIAPEDLEDLVHHSRVKGALQAASTLSEEARRSMEDYIDFAWDRDRQARRPQGEPGGGNQAGAGRAWEAVHRPAGRPPSRRG